MGVNNQFGQDFQVLYHAEIEALELQCRWGQYVADATEALAVSPAYALARFADVWDGERDKDEHVAEFVRLPLFVQQVIVGSFGDGANDAYERLWKLRKDRSRPHVGVLRVGAAR